MGFKEESFTSFTQPTFFMDGYQFFDANGDGKSEGLIGNGTSGTALQLAFFHKDENIYNIQKISNGLGADINITYQQLDKTSAYTKYNNASYPLFDIETPLPIVTTTQKDNGLGGYFEQDYQYEGLVGNRLGIPGPGFQKLTITDHASNNQTVSEFSIFDNNGLYYFKYPSHIVKYALQADGTVNYANKIMEKTNTIEIKNTVAGNQWIYYPVMTKSVTKLWDNGSPNTFLRMETDTRPIDKIDNWGNSTESTVTISNNEQGTVYTTTTYKSSFTQNMDTTNWIIDRPDYTLVTNHYVNDSKDKTVKTNYTYYGSGDAAWPLVNTREVVPNNNALYRNETAYKYDVYGNITKTTLSAPDLSVPTNPPLVTKVTDYEYNEANGNNGRFLTAVTRHNGATGFKSTFRYNLSDGTLSKSTDADGLNKNYEYGPFGKLIKVTNADGSSTTTGVHWKSWSSISGMAPQNGVYAIFTINPNHSEQIVFYDVLEREVRKMVTGLTNDQWIGVDKVYDDRGFLKMVSQPYFSGSTPSEGNPTQWTTYTRDPLNNKIVSITSPTNTLAITHSGLQTTTTNNATGVAKTTTADPLGRTKSIADPTGTINYEYYSSGELKSGNVAGRLTSLTYDDAGRKQKIIGPNSDTTQYTYSNFGEIISQEDNKGNNYKMTYDELGRLKTRTLANTSKVTTYNYNDVAGSNGFGRLENIQGPNNITYQYTYDNYGRLITEKEVIDNVQYTSRYTYDSIGQLDRLTYPSGYSVRYLYSPTGALSEVIDGTNGSTVLWKANAINRRGQLTGFTLGNGLSTTKQYNDLSGLPESIITQNAQGGKVQDLEYGFDQATGNLSWRKDQLYNLTENFGYDNVLHSRLSSWQVTGQTGYTADLANNGNIVSKSDVTGTYTDGGGNLVSGQYLYGSTSNTQAVEKVTHPTAGFKQNAFPQNITYTGFNKIKDIQQTNTEAGRTHTYQYSLEYGPDFLRKMSTLMEDSVTREVKYYVAGNYEVETDAHGHQRKLNYLYGGDGLFAIYVQNNNADTMYYVQKNYLGSYYCVTGADGKVVSLDGEKQVYSFDPWGRRRNATTWTYNNVPQTFLFDRGFTGHEHLDVFGLINMNGRAYDSWLGRFLSMDPTTQGLTSTQNYNRYTYALNNPLKYVDPTGYSDISSIIRQLWDSPYGGYWNSGDESPTIFNSSAEALAYVSNNFIQLTTGGTKKVQRQIVIIYNKQQNGTPYYYDENNGQVWDFSKLEFADAGVVLAGKTYDSNGDFYMYFLPAVDITGKRSGQAGGGGQISIDESHNRIGFVPLDVGSNYGAFQMANYRANVSIRGNQNNIFVGVTNSNTPVSGGQVVFNASASLVVDGNVIQKQALVNGSARFELPNVSNVSLTIKGGWNVYFDSGGASVPVYHPIFWPFSLNFKDDFKLK